MANNKDLSTYTGTFNYQGYVWEGSTQASNQEHAFSKLIAGMAKHCNTTAYSLRNYFLERRQQWEVKCVK